MGTGQPPAPGNSATAPGSGRIPPQENGWVAIVVNDGQVQAVQPTEAPRAQANGFKVIPPIQVNKRQFGLPEPSWTKVSTVTLAYTFISQTNIFPVDGTSLKLYGVSGYVEYEATVVSTVTQRTVIFNFDLPVYNGVFYFSARFAETTVTLTNKVEIDIREYYSVGIYGGRSIYNEPLPNPPVLLSGVTDVISPNTCDLGDGGALGSQIGVILKYKGGTVKPGSVINNFVLFFPSGSLFVFDTSPNRTYITPPDTISTDDICMRFGSDRIIYYSVWITDANGLNSNSIGNYFEAGIGLNSTDNGQPVIGPVKE